MSIDIKNVERLNKDDRKIKKQISSWLVNCKKLVIMGIGNPLRSDDAVGVLTVAELEKLSPLKKVVLIRCETVPENYLHTVEEEAPSHLLLIDAVDAGIKPGSIVFRDLKDSEKLSVSTHSIPLSTLANFLKNTLNVKIMLLGIQIADLSFSEEISNNMVAVPSKVAMILKEVMETNS